MSNDFFDDRTAEHIEPWTPPPSRGVVIQPEASRYINPFESQQIDNTVKAPLPHDTQEVPLPRRSWKWFIRALVALDFALVGAVIVVAYAQREEKPAYSYVGAGTITTVVIETTMPPTTVPTTVTTVHQATTSRLTTTSAAVTTMCRS